MVKRIRAQWITDDLAFPVRVKLAVPAHGLGISSERIAAWLNSELGPSRYAWHSAQSIGTAATALYFTTAEDAQRFVAHFPDMELADGTQSVAYTSPSIRRVNHDP